MAQVLDQDELREAEHQLFVAQHNRSRIGVAEIIRWLYLHDWEIWAEQSVPSPDYEHRLEYVDDGDIWARRRGTEKWVRIEVKYWEKNDFNGAHDMPYKDFIICKAHVWDNADPKPLAFLTVNPRRTRVAIVLGSTAPDWKRWTYETNNFDHHMETVYRCSVDKLLFRDIDK